MTHKGDEILDNLFLRLADALRKETVVDRGRHSPDDEALDDGPAGGLALPTQLAPLLAALGQTLESLDVTCGPQIDQRLLVRGRRPCRGRVERREGGRVRDDGEVS